MAWGWPVHGAVPPCVAMRTRILSLATVLALGVPGCDRGPANGGAKGTQPGAQKRTTPAPAKGGAGPGAAEPDAPAADEGPAANEPPASVQYLEAGGLHYLEQTLGEAGPDDALPMIVAIHGLGDRPENFAHLLDGFPEPARLILPRGIDEYEGGWSWFPLRARDRDVDALAGGLGNASDTIAQGLAAIAQTRPTRGAPIVTGFSQGGMLTFTLAVKHPEVVGAAIPVGGWLPPPLWPEEEVGAKTRGPAIDALHGTDDRAVLYEPTQESVTHLEGLGYDVTLHTYEGVPHVIDPQMRLDLTDRLVDEVRKAAKKPAPKQEEAP